MSSQEVSSHSNSLLVEKMQGVVEKVCSTYKEDFYEYDHRNLSSRPTGEFLWFVHESGTRLVWTTGTDSERDYYRLIVDHLKNTKGNGRFVKDHHRLFL